MAPTPAIRALRRHPAAAEIARAWRRLAASAPTLVACSGGPDSSALAFALAAANADLALAHVVHHGRTRDLALADRDATRTLARVLACPFLEAEIPPARASEAAMRDARYAALADLADRSGRTFVATAHHADDQLETMLLALARGTALSGLAGMPPLRTLTEHATLVRPCLAVRRIDLASLCAQAEWTPRHDHTNDTASTPRNALRNHAMPALLAVLPGLIQHAPRTANLLRDAAHEVADAAARLLDTARIAPTTFDRAPLRAARAVVLARALRSLALASDHHTGADALTARVLDPAVDAIRDQSTEPREFHWPRGIVVRVDAHRITLRHHAEDR